jgi:pre-rRNA-processing protein TSR3
MCLVLLDRDDQARRILAPFGWGEQFLILNEEPLKAYKNAETRQEILDLQWEFFDRPDGI